MSTRPRSLMMTAFGWNDPGGGTTVPRLAAKELARRGWDVTVFHAAVQPTPSRIPYELREWDDDGVRLIGVHNRPHGLFDLGNPSREVDDPPITQAFAAALERLSPGVVHFHNLHNLGAALIDQAAVRGLPAYFTTHNYWLICPRAYLLTGEGMICDGPGDGGRCAACVGSADLSGHQLRLSTIRSKAVSGLNRILAVSQAVRHALVGAGYPADAVDVVRQAMPHELEIWAQVGRARPPGRLRERLTVAFLGSAYPHKGPQLLVEAAQRTDAQLDVRIIGEIPDQFAKHLRELDRRGTLSLAGSFAPADIGRLLSDVDVAVLPSMWWDCAPLAAAECMAARLPLLVPRLGGLPESIRDGIDGLEFDALDAAGLACQLDRLASENGLLEHLQANILEPRTFAAYIDELEAYYRGEHEAGQPWEPSSPLVRWQGDHGLTTSLSIINDEITRRLPYTVRRADRGSRNLDPPLAHPADIEVRQQWPPDFEVPPSGRFATIVPWEFGSIPTQWLVKIRSRVDELWVPSEYVRRMYVDSGVDADAVRVIPNGVDLDTFRPGSVPDAQPDHVRFLYVGGFNARKGPDLLLHALGLAFAGRDDITLVMKTSTGGGAYGGPHELVRERAASDLLPRLELIEDDLDTEELARLYQSCQVFVLPYRGEGFAMPVLEAMACGLPVIVTAGGPTDEYCPPEAGWRIRSVHKDVPPEELEDLEMVHQPWMLEPDLDHLVALLETAASATPAELAAKGRAGRVAAEKYSWDAIAAQYSQRIAELAVRPVRRVDRFDDPFPFQEDVELRVLATPAWRGADRLGELLSEWAGSTTPGTSACLYLLADPSVAGSGEQLEGHVVRAADQAGVDLEACADINVLMEPFRDDRDQRLHRTVDAYLPLHAACEGHLRLARLAGTAVLALGDGSLAAAVRSL